MLVSVDASQIEWRAAIELSGDIVGRDEVNNGEDAHTKNQLAFELPSRLIAKIYLFRTIFRGSGYAFSKDNAFRHVSSSPKYWDRVNEKFYEKYYGLDKWHHQLCDTVMRGDIIVSPFGREWFIEPKIDYKGDLVPPWTIFSNYPVQGTSADIMTIARLSANRRLLEAGIEFLWVSTIHDSLVFDIPNPDDAQQIVNICSQVFDDLPKNISRLFGYDWKTRLDCEAKIGNDMHNMKQLHRNDLKRT